MRVTGLYRGKAETAHDNLVVSETRATFKFHSSLCKLKKYIVGLEKFRHCTELVQITRVALYFKNVNFMSFSLAELYQQQSVKFENYIIKQSSWDF